jgi:hypothetical protein
MDNEYTADGSDMGGLISFSLEDGGSMFLSNVGTHLQIHMATQPRRLSLTDINPMLT